MWHLFFILDVIGLVHLLNCAAKSCLAFSVVLFVLGWLRTVPCKYCLGSSGEKKILVLLHPDYFFLVTAQKYAFVNERIYELAKVLTLLNGSP